MGSSNCAKLGEVIDVQQSKNWPNATFFSSEYRYSDKLKTCIYKSSLIDKDGVQRQWIEDLYTNKPIVVCPVDEDGNKITQEEFNKRFADLFRD